MFGRLAAFVVRRRRAVMVVGVVFLALCGVIGGGVASRLSNGGFDDPASDSYRASAALSDEFHAGPPNFLLLVRAAGGVDSPTAARDGRALTTRLAGEHRVSQVASYWVGGGPDLRSRDSQQALVLARVTGSDDQVLARVKQLKRAYAGRQGSLSVRVGGVYVSYDEIGTRIRKDLQVAETVAFPVTFVLLVLVFGGVIAALLPLVIGAFAVLGTFLVLEVLTAVTSVSIYALNMTTALGLGLAIDYSLFIVSRYREEIAAGRSAAEAVDVSLRTAGRTVAFSALTVALSLAALLVFPLYFLRSFAYAGIAVVAMGTVGALVLLPAMLAALGTRVDSLRLWRRRPRQVGEGFWHRVAVGVMRRPVLIGGAVIALLVVLGLPFLRVKFGLADDRILPPSASAHQVAQALRDDFPSRESDAIQVVLPHTRPGPAALSGYAETLSRMAGVARVDAASGSYSAGAQVAPASAASARFTGADGTWLSVVPTVEAYSDAGTALVRGVRAARAPGPTLVTGQSARLADTEQSLGHRLPVAGALIALATLVVLFLFTGSVLVPVKAIVLNLLSLSATFGAMVWIFQEGHLRGLLGNFIVTGTLDTTTPLLMFCVAFGLSMDYEVFLLSRIREEWVVTGDNPRAVALGLERTGRLITAAALLISVVFLSFASSGITFIKLFGLGMAIAVVVDATLVRGALVPAFMRIAGRANWWAPGPLRRLHARFGLAEAGTPLDLPAPRREAAARLEV